MVVAAAAVIFSVFFLSLCRIGIYGISTQPIRINVQLIIVLLCGTNKERQDKIRQVIDDCDDDTNNSVRRTFVRWLLGAPGLLQTLLRYLL